MGFNSIDQILFVFILITSHDSYIFILIIVFSDYLIISVAEKKYMPSNFQVTNSSTVLQAPGENNKNSATRVTQRLSPQNNARLQPRNTTLVEYPAENMPRNGLVSALKTIFIAGLTLSGGQRPIAAQPVLDLASLQIDSIDSKSPNCVTLPQAVVLNLINKEVLEDLKDEPGLDKLRFCSKKNIDLPDRAPAEPPPDNAKYKNLAALTFIAAEEQLLKNIKYLTVEERAHYRVQIQNGLLYDSQNRLFDTQYSRTIQGRPKRAIYVMEHDGTFYIKNNPVKNEFYHSSFLAGKPVAAAGEIQVTLGRIQMISRHSGHYKPNLDHFAQAVAELQSSKVINNFIIENEVHYTGPTDYEVGEACREVAGQSALVASLVYSTWAIFRSKRSSQEHLIEEWLSKLPRKKLDLLHAIALNPNQALTTQTKQRDHLKLIEQMKEAGVTPDSVSAHLLKPSPDRKEKQVAAQATASSSRHSKAARRKSSHR